MLFISVFAIRIFVTINETLIETAATTQASIKLPIPPSGAIKISAESKPGHAPSTYSLRAKIPAIRPADAHPAAVPIRSRGRSIRAP